MKDLGPLRGLPMALGFLTRAPLPAWAFGDARAQADSLAWYPAVGLLIGTMLCALSWLLHGATAWLSAAVVLTAWVASTGAMHLDGLADSADAWVGGLGDRERTLAIMKDPRCGPVGVVALVLLLLLKFAALASLSREHAYVLLLAPVLARAALTAAFLSLPYVRSGGLGAGLTAAPRGACAAAILLSVVLGLAFGLRGLLALASAGVVFWLWRRACRQRLDGFTGDTAGALAEITEAVVLVVLAAAV